MILPEDGDVANAIGAVVGQVAIHAQGSATSAGEGAIRVHLPSGVSQYEDSESALAALRMALTEQAEAQAKAAGVSDIRISERLDLKEAQVPIGTDEVACVAVGDPFEVVLMLRLGFPKFTHGFDLSHHFPGP